MSARFRVLLMACGCLAALFHPRAEATESEADAAPAQASGEASRWFILPSMINVYPKLGSEALIEQLYNPAMRLIAPGFDDVRTVRTLRDMHLLWTPDFAIGRVMSRYWALYLHLGYEAGKVRTKAHDRSIFLVPFRTDFEIYRSAAYFGLCADIFPMGMPERREYRGLWDRLRNTKPTIGLRFTETKAGFEAKAKGGFTKYTHFLDLKFEGSWLVPAFNANIGAEIPLGKRDALSLNAGYNFALSRDFDFDAQAYTIGWKHYFK